MIINKNTNSSDLRFETDCKHSTRHAKSRGFYSELHLEKEVRFSRFSCKMMSEGSQDLTDAPALPRQQKRHAKLDAGRHAHAFPSPRCKCFVCTCLFVRFCVLLASCCGN